MEISGLEEFRCVCGDIRNIICVHVFTYVCTYVTGFAKTDRIVTTTEIQFNI